MLNAPPEVISDVANTNDPAKKIVILVDQINRAIGEFITKQEQNALARETQIIDQLTEMNKQMGRIQLQLSHRELEMVAKGLNSFVFLIVMLQF